MTVALLAIMLDESDYVDRWVRTIERAHLIGAPFDQVVVVDGGSNDDTVRKLGRRGVAVTVRPFSDNFAEQRNFGIEMCQTDWIFELDADEYPATPLIAGLKAIARDADCALVDTVGFARLNLLDGRLVEGPGHNGFDYQYRLHRRECRWQGAVHEEIANYKNRIELPFIDGHLIVHDKSTTRHLARNAYYDKLRGE